MGRAVSTSSIVAQSDRARQAKRLAKKREDPFFRSYLQSMRQMLSGGQTLFDIRDKLGIKKDQEWHDLLTVMAQAFANPENIMLEWSVRQNARYAMAADMLNRAKAAKNFDAEARSIMMMVKIDENFLELQKVLGLIKPIEDGNGGSGYSSGDLADAEDKFTRLVEERIVSKLEAERTVEPPISLQLLIGSQSGGESDQLEETTLVEDTTPGHQS